LDSSHADVRARATVILSHFLDRLDSSTLAKTGLAEVLWAAVAPNLAALPPVTDLDDSVHLLKVTYPALISLAKLWHPSPRDRLPLWDKLVRDGVIYSMMYSGEKIKIAEVTLDALDLMIEEMRIHFVKHLKVLSLFSSLISVRYPSDILCASESGWK